MYKESDFFHVADWLVIEADDNINSEAMYRAAISRYYYACFLTARKFLVKKKDWDNPNKSLHSDMVKILKNKRKPIGEAYESLFILREHADYHCWAVNIRDAVSGNHPACRCKNWNEDMKKTAEYAHDLAEGILNHFKP